MYVTPGILSLVFYAQLPKDSSWVESKFLFLPFSFPGSAVLSVTSRDLSLATSHPGESQNSYKAKRGKEYEYFYL